MQEQRTKPILGIPEMDTQHDYLYLLFDKLIVDLTNDEMATLLDEIAGYLDFHLTSEEHFIRHYKVPGFAAHKSDHELAAQSFLKYVDDFERGCLNPARLRNSMIGWLAEHSQSADMEYADFVRDLRCK
jgi:hemerythrin-like metal-binding protein